MDLETHSRQADVAIAGGGFAGLALAIALKQALGPRFLVCLADPAFSGQAANDGRASAIAAAARRLLQTIGVWRRVADKAQPICGMDITDSRLRDAIRPQLLHFEEELAGEPFAHMIENGFLMEALVERAQEADVALAGAAITGFALAPSHLEMRFADGQSGSCRLLVAADGARSRLRDLAGIPVYGWSYGQSGIVTTVAHERDHRGRAEQHFLPAGPFAILPLTGRRSSIVWVEEEAAARRIVELPDELFLAELERRFGLRLGELSLVGPRRLYPLSLFIARRFVGERLALVGDAAHVIHPLAGQGLNMGLRDVAALAESVADAARLGLDIGGAPVLERYQRWRRFDTMTMGLATDGLNRLFSNDLDAVRLVRDAGLSLVERLSFLKRLFIREAAGVTGDTPRLLRGEAL